jgi:hypothetical protein
MVHAVSITMNTRIYLTGLVLIATLTTYGQNTTTTMEKTAKPISCKLTSVELQKRKTTVIAELKALVLSRHELTDGYGYEFEGNDDILDKLNTFIKTERMCCDFFTFQLTVEENKAILNITGPEGAKEFLKEEVDL